MKYTLPLAVKACMAGAEVIAYERGIFFLKGKKRTKYFLNQNFMMPCRKEKKQYSH